MTYKNTSAIAVDVTRCHGSVVMGTLDLVRELQEFECFDIALFFDDFLGLANFRLNSRVITHGGILPTCGCDASFL